MSFMGLGSKGGAVETEACVEFDLDLGVGREERGCEGWAESRGLGEKSGVDIAMTRGDEAGAPKDESRACWLTL